MKKLINEPTAVVKELIEGYLAAFGNKLEKVPDVNGIVTKKRQDKVAVVIGGGSGHEPLFLGFVGEGLADGAVLGNVFAAPPPDTIQAVVKAVDAGKGVLFVYGNYTGDVMNFDMAAELCAAEAIETRTVLVWDDVASAPPERAHERRGIAGDVFVIKIAGAAASAGLSLAEVCRVTEKARDHTRSIGIALAPGSTPDTGKPTFVLGDDEIEFGMGLHGELGVRRTRMMRADAIVTEMMGYLFKDMPLQSGDEVCLLINGLGSTTLMEQFIVNRQAAVILREQGILVHETLVNSYCTCQEMAGVSISLMKLDEELKKYWDCLADSPYFRK